MYSNVSNVRVVNKGAKGSAYRGCAVQVSLARAGWSLYELHYVENLIFVVKGELHVVNSAERTPLFVGGPMRRVSRALHYS